MSATIFRDTSPEGRGKRAIHVTDDGNVVRFTVTNNQGVAIATIPLDLDMADGLGRHVRHRVLDIRMEQEARHE